MSKNFRQFCELIESLFAPIFGLITLDLINSLKLYSGAFTPKFPIVSFFFGIDGGAKIGRFTIMMKSCRSVFGLLVGMIFCATGNSQTFLSFEKVDYVTVQDFQRFQEVWDKAESQNVRIALFGDSQETSPGGAGRVYVPRLNYEFFKHFGKIGESFVAPGIGSYGGGAPPAEWLLLGAPGSVVGHEVGLPLRQRLPGVSTRIYRSNAFGQNTLLDTSNLNLEEGTEIPGVPLWDLQDLSLIHI